MSYIQVGWGGFEKVALLGAWSCIRRQGNGMSGNGMSGARPGGARPWGRGCGDCLRGT